MRRSLHRIERVAGKERKKKDEYRTHNESSASKAEMLQVCVRARVRACVRVRARARARVHVRSNASTCDFYLKQRRCKIAIKRLDVLDIYISPLMLSLALTIHVLLEHGRHLGRNSIHRFWAVERKNCHMPFLSKQNDRLHVLV